MQTTPATTALQTLPSRTVSRPLPVAFFVLILVSTITFRGKFLPAHLITVPSAIRPIAGRCFSKFARASNHFFLQGNLIVHVLTSPGSFGSASKASKQTRGPVFAVRGANLNEARTHK